MTRLIFTVMLLISSRQLSPYGQKTYFPNANPYSTSSLVSMNILPLLGLLRENKNPVSRLQKALLKEEADDYVDHIFSRSKIVAITSLKGDSLQHFIEQYKPSILKLKKMTEYELLIYIKNKLCRIY